MAPCIQLLALISVLSYSILFIDSVLHETGWLSDVCFMYFIVPSTLIWYHTLLSILEATTVYVVYKTDN